MKFVVTREPYGNNVDVRLHWESKDKIKKIASYGLLVVVAVVGARSYVNNLPADAPISE